MGLTSDGDNWITSFPFGMESMLYDEEPDWREFVELDAYGVIRGTIREPANLPAWLIDKIGGDVTGLTEWGLPVRQVDFVLASG